jgi:subfamily B ATP-binding cassette protein HlyB/CyaB
MVNGKKQLLPISTETFLWALQCACQVHRVPFAAEMALRQFSSPYNSAILQHALHELGLKGRWRKVQETDFEHLNFPCFAALNPPDDPEFGKEQSESDTQVEQQLETYGLALLVRLEKNTVLFFEPGSQEPQHLPLTEFTIRCAGHVLQFAAPKTKDVDDEDKEFGFRWFVPELLKHKKVWYDVLLASLALQLVGMATPLFTQTIIDKVIVHHTMSNAGGDRSRHGYLHGVQRCHELGAAVSGNTYRQPYRLGVGCAGIRAFVQVAATLF